MMNLLNWTPYKTILMKTMILLSFHAFLRAGEMTDSNNNLMSHQLDLGDRWLKLSFKHYKHSKGAPVKLKIRRQFTKFCPVSAMTLYLRYRGSRPGY